MKLIYLNLLILGLLFNFVELEIKKNFLPHEIKAEHKCHYKCLKRMVRDKLATQTDQNIRPEILRTFEANCEKECKNVSARFLNFNIYQSNQNYYHNQIPEKNIKDENIYTENYIDNMNQAHPSNSIP